MHVSLQNYKLLNVSPRKIFSIFFNDFEKD